jgi:GAF domain-containing protein
VGVLVFALPPDRVPDDGDRAYAVALAQQCAQALERSRAYEAQKRLAEQVSALHSTAAALSGASAPKEIAEHVFRALAGLGASAVELHVTEPPDRVALLVRHGPAVGARSAPVPVDAPLPAPEVVRTGKALWLESPEEIGTRFPEMEPIRRWRGEGAWAVVPLLAGGRTLGALVAAFPGPHRFDADERTFLRALAQPCAQSVERSRVYEAAAAEQAEAERYAAMLEETFDAAPIAIGLLDTSLVYVRANRRLAEIHGIAPAAHRGNTPTELLPGPAGEAIAAACRTVLESGEAVHDVGIVGETPADPGTTRRWSASIFPVHASDKISGVGIVVREARA